MADDPRGFIQAGPGRFIPAAEAEAAKDNPFHPLNHSADPALYWVPPPKAGDGQPVSCRVSSQTQRWLAEVAASGRWPFRTPSDIVRAAVHWFMAEIVGPQESRLSDEVKLANEEVWQAQREKELADAERIVAMKRDYLTRLLKLGLEEQAVEAWNRTETSLKALGVVGEAMLQRLYQAPELARLKSIVVKTPLLPPDQEDGA